MRASYETARSADGPTVVAWVRARINLGRDDPLQQTLNGWDKPGRLVGIFALDRWLLPVGIHPSELPDEAWRFTNPGTTVKFRPTAERICRLWMIGAGRTEIAKAIGVRPSRVDEVAGQLERATA